MRLADMKYSRLSGILFSVAAFSVILDGADAISSRDMEVDGVRLHYLTAGQGSGLILLHGYTQTSLMWKPIIPSFSERFTVVAPDLPGIGDSSIPSEGLDLKSAAIRIHGLAHALGLNKVELVGHDIGLMVAYAYAALYPDEVSKLIVMDAFLPGVGAWKDIYDNPGYWHFRFNGPTPEELVRGREPIYFAYFWNDLAADKNHSIPAADRQAYVTAYSRPGRMRAGWAYFVSFQQAAIEFAKFAQKKLPMPVLSIGGDKSLGPFLGNQMKLAASNVTVVVIANSGHWVMEEQPQATTSALLKFL